MDTKKLEALAAAVEHGSFTRAAEALGYTQSGMTHMMNSLERDIGFPVLLRGRAGVRLTPAGERIYPLVRQVLSASQALDREITLINSHKEDTIRVAAYSSIAMHWLPEVIQQFRRVHPELTVDIQMGSVEEVYRWVREDKADMGEDPLLAILPPEYDLGGRERFDVRDFSSHEFLMPSMGFHLDILRALNRSGVTPVIRTTQVSDSVIISMVEHGLGVSVLSELVLKGRRDAVQAVPLDPPAFRELGIVTRDRRELRPAARRFITEARDIIRQIK